MLMIGGDDDGNDIGLWKYDIVSNCWTPIKCLGFTPGNQAVLTSDERFVIIEERDSADLWILDIRNDHKYSAKRSVAVPPWEASRGNINQDPDIPLC